MSATIYAARVVGVDADGPLVRIPALSADEQWGPMPTMVGGLTVGEAVAVANLGATRDQMLVLGRMFGRLPGVEEIPGLSDTLDTVTGRLDTLTGGQSAHTALLETHGNRLDDIDAGQQTQDGRITAVEGRATAIEGVNNTQNTRLTEVEKLASRRPVGDIEITWRSTPKENTLLMTGQEVSKATYADLWAFAQAQGLVGTVFTAGSSDASFRLPDMRGKTVIGAGTSPDGTLALGQLVGVATNSLTLAHLPPHTHRAVTEAYEHSHGPAGDHNHGSSGNHAHQHAFHRYAGGSHSHGDQPGTTSEGPNAAAGGTAATAHTGEAGTHSHATSGSHTHFTDMHIHDVNVDPAGDGAPVENRQPSIAVNWLVWV